VTVGIARDQRTYPDTIVLFDDKFDQGFHGWEELAPDSSGSSTVQNSSPLTIGDHGHYSGRSLKMQTFSVADPAYGSACNAIRRLVHPAAYGRVTAEWWFSYGGENQGPAATEGLGGAPRYIVFGIDQTPPADSPTQLGYGNRAFFAAKWRQWNENAQPTVSSVASDSTGFTVTFSAAHTIAAGMQAHLTGFTPSGINGDWIVASITSTTIRIATTTNPGNATVQGSVIAQRTCDWFLNTKSAVDYPGGGYISPNDGNFLQSGYVADLPYNGNKRNQQYVKLVVETNPAAPAYKSLQVNHHVFDLTACPGGPLSAGDSRLSGGVVAAPVSAEPLYNDPSFTGGLNFYLSLINRAGTTTTASYLEVHRARGSYEALV
jgi:hypothetical protein